MIFAPSLDAVSEIICSEDDVDRMLLLSNKVALPEGFIEEIEARFAGEMLFIVQKWIEQQSSVQGRLRMVDNGSIDHYGFDKGFLGRVCGSGFHAANNLLLSEVDEGPLPEGYGLRRICKADNADFFTKGDNPVERIVLAPGGSMSPECLRPFFSKEKSVTFFDNYLNKKSLSAVAFLCRFLADKAKIFVVTKNKSGAEEKEWVRAVKKVNKSLSLQFVFPKKGFFSESHDRHIFLGKRYHIHLSNGLDSFGDDKAWLNSECVINVSDVYENYEEVDFNNGSRLISVRYEKSG